MTTEAIIDTIKRLPLSAQLRVAAEVLYAIDQQNRVTGPRLLPSELRAWWEIQAGKYDAALKMQHGESFVEPSPTVMTLERFRTLGNRFGTHVAERACYQCQDEAQAVLVYGRDQKGKPKLFIEDFGPEAQGGRYYLITDANYDWRTDNLAGLEEKLYEYALEEGILAEIVS